MRICSICSTSIAYAVRHAGGAVVAVVVVVLTVAPNPVPVPGRVDVVVVTGGRL